MHKPILITGPQGSGKTKKAEEIASQFQDDEVVYIQYDRKLNYKDRLAFSECTEKTKMIVIDNLWDLRQVEPLVEIISNPIIVHEKYQKPFRIEPKIVVVCLIDHPQTAEISEEVDKLFDVINCDQEMSF